MKISEILKNQGVFSKDIKQRFQQNQIRINGESVQDIDIPVHCIFDGADWFFINFFSKLNKDQKEMLIRLIFFTDSLETLFDGGFSINDVSFETLLPELSILKEYLFLRTSKREFLIIELKIDNLEDTSTWD